MVKKNYTMCLDADIVQEFDTIKGELGFKSRSLAVNSCMDSVVRKHYEKITQDKIKALNDPEYLPCSNCRKYFKKILPHCPFCHMERI